METRRVDAPCRNADLRFIADETLCATMSDMEVHWLRGIPTAGIESVSRHRCRGRDCRFLFCLACTSHNDSYEEIGSRVAEKQHPRIVAGNCYLFCKCNCHNLAGEMCGDACLMEIRLACRHLLHLLGRHRLALVLSRAQRMGRPLTVAARMTPPMNQALRQMDARLAGQDAPPLFTVAKASELMWLFADAFEKEPEALANSRDLKAVRAAQKILESCLVDPPSLPNLAAKVGMSLSKFKTLFSRVCGSTPYAYLRQVRMDRAFQLLNETDLSVTEVALEVGYSSLSRFSQAFAGRFGMNPSMAKRMHVEIR